MKKITVMAIIIAMLVALTSVVCATSVTAESGKEVTLTFKLGNTGVRTGDYTIEYNSDYLTYKSATPADKVKYDTSVLEAEATDGTFKSADGTRFAGNSTTGKDTFTVTLKVKEGTTAQSADISIINAKQFVTRAGEERTSYDVEVGAKATVALVESKGPDDQQEEEPGTTPPTVDGNENNNNNNNNNDNSNNNSDNQTSTENKDTEVSATSEDDKTRYDQTGANVAIVAGIALVAILGAVALRKRA